MNKKYIPYLVIAGLAFAAWYFLFRTKKTVVSGNTATGGGNAGATGNTGTTSGTTGGTNTGTGGTATTVNTPVVSDGGITSWVGVVNNSGNTIAATTGNTAAAYAKGNLVLAEDKQVTTFKLG